MGRMAAQVMKPRSQTIMKKVLVNNLLTISVFVSFQVFYRVFSLSLKPTFPNPNLIKVDRANDITILNLGTTRTSSTDLELTIKK